MFKYTITAYNFDQSIGAVERIQIVVTAPNVVQAIKRAAVLAVRQNYAVEAIEDLRGSKLNKLK